jgi:hypothetical protein
MDFSGGVTIPIYTFQTVKLNLETWTLIAEVMKRKNTGISESLELLVRHGAIRLLEVEKKLDTEAWPQ